MPFCLPRELSKVYIGRVEVVVRLELITLVVLLVVWIVVVIGLVVWIETVLRSIVTVDTKGMRPWFWVQCQKLGMQPWYAIIVEELGTMPKTVFRNVVVATFVVDNVVVMVSSLVVQNVVLVIANMCIVCRIRWLPRLIPLLPQSPGHQKTDLGQLLVVWC
jgi:hypothetical protein